MTLFLGTSGWQYRHWRRGVFYTEGLPARGELAWYATQFATVEVNATFYFLPEAKTFRAWRANSPPGFVFALKMNRFLTHIRRLQQPREVVRRFLARAELLEEKLGPVLLQLPPYLKRDDANLTAALAAFPREVRVAVEPPHDTWFTGEVLALLRAHGAALCLADRRSRWITPVARTADWAYVRFHHGAGEHGCYGDTALTARAHTIAETWSPRADVYAYFNTDGHGCAPRDARRFCRFAGELGLRAHVLPEQAARGVRFSR